jgi:antitoxin FitA
MSNLLIRDVEDATVERLKIRAKLNRTSLQQEASKALKQGTTLTGAERFAIVQEARKAGRLPKVTVMGADVVRAIRDDEYEL